MIIFHQTKNVLPRVIESDVQSSNLLRTTSYQQAQHNISPLLNISSAYKLEDKAQHEQSRSIRLTTFSVNSDFVKTIKNFKIEKTHRQKQARFRWFLAYSLLNNCRLCYQRKYIQSRNLLDSNCS